MEKYNVVINADMGESFGRYKLGNDEELIKYVTSANVACGFHAGDPTVMRETVRLAKQYGVAVGAHPGFQDLRGFGRRMMDITPEEVTDNILYQLGALGAFLKAEGMKMWHISPHGMFNPLVAKNEKYAEAFIRGIQEYSPELIIIIESKSLLYKKAQLSRLKVAAVAFPDLKYDSEGNWMIEHAKRPADPTEVARQAVSIIKNHKLRTIDGKELEAQAEVLCFHGDAPNSVEVLRRVREEFGKEGINIVSW